MLWKIVSLHHLFYSKSCVTFFLVGKNKIVLSLIILKLLHILLFSTKDALNKFKLFYDRHIFIKFLRRCTRARRVICTPYVMDIFSRTLFFVAMGTFFRVYLWISIRGNIVRIIRWEESKAKEIAGCRGRWINTVKGATNLSTERPREAA